MCYVTCHRQSPLKLRIMSLIRINIILFGLCSSEFDTLKFHCEDGVFQLNICNHLPD
jgi:hypothetical protein